MNNSTSYDIAIIGGGLAGLCAAIHLGSYYSVLLIEKQTYPSHKVCGEYISNEVLLYLLELGIDPIKEGAKAITKFEMSTRDGVLIKAILPLGGFGMSRYALDKLLFEKAKITCDTVQDTVISVDLKEGLAAAKIFQIQTKASKSYTATYVLGAYGKRSNLDIHLKRDFITKKSPWLGVKAHYELDMPEDVVALHNFRGGYCGVSKVENGIVNVCYLTTFKSFKEVGDIDIFQKEVLSKNKHLKRVFEEGRCLWEKPLTISQISFNIKEPVKNHILMIGDSAGMIHPLAGNGMAMAIHSASLVSEILIAHQISNPLHRENIERSYRHSWNNQFKDRLQVGRIIQKLLLSPKASKISLGVAKLFPGIVPAIIKKTHGTVKK
jgi:flavin-dependent dehydrogenase